MQATYPITPPLSFNEGAPPPIHPLLPHYPSIHLLWGLEPSQDQGPPLPLMPDEAILRFLCSWSHGSLHLYSLVGGLAPGNFGGQGCLVGWYCCSSYGFANPFSSFSPFSNSSVQDPVLSSLVGCDHPPPYLSGSGRASQESSISGFLEYS